MGRWRTTYGILGWCIVIFCAANALAAERPNLVFVVTDDQGQWAMGAYGNEEIHTPNMDRIAHEGALFENAFVVTPVCSPSRATFLTGLYPTELGITDWIAPDEAEAGLGLEADTWPQELQRFGYRTALIGKWHLGELPEYHPTKLGYDYFMGFLAGGNSPMDPTLEVYGQETELEGPLPDILADASLKWLDKHGTEPFALSLHFRAPHLPYGPVPEEDSAPYADLDPTIPEFPGVDVEKLKKSTRDYYASITSIDRNVGRVLDKLEALGVDDRTIVIFTSDHGYNEGRHGINTKGNGHWIAGGVHGPKRPNMWDTSLRIPLAIRWPGVVRPFTTIESTVTNLDFYRTILGMLKLPLTSPAQARGTDFSPLLRGEDVDIPDMVFGQYDLHNNGLAYLRMVRTPEYKLVVHYHARMMDELYDLKNDPGELRNLLRGNRPREEKHGPVYSNLRKLLFEWMRFVEDPLLNDAY